MKNYFEYQMPYVRELKEMYLTPYRFSDELRTYVDYMFSHPQHNKYAKIYAAHSTKWTSNDMLKPAYLMLKYYYEYPQRFGHDVNNVVPHMIVAMWKTFLGTRKILDKVEFKQYYPASMRLLVLGENKFMDILARDVETYNLVLHSDDMIKRREGLGLTERKKPKSSSRYIDYLCSLP